MGFVEHVARRVTIGGRVQGVWFRDSCKRQADRLGVVGWVRNRHDGTVEGEFEGPDNAVEALVGWCRRGPSQAEVTSLDVVDVMPTGAETFEVARTV